MVNTPLDLYTVQNVTTTLGVFINPQATASEIYEILELLLNYKDVFGKDGKVNWDCTLMKSK